MGNYIGFSQLLVLLIHWNIFRFKALGETRKIGVFLCLHAIDSLGESRIKTSGTIKKTMVEFEHWG